MGLYLYFFQQEEYIRMYNCSFYSVDMLPLEQRKRFASAILILILGILFEILYFPCVYAMLQKKVREAFCYKLMLEMAIYDMLTLPLTAFFPAYFSYYGYMFCSYPTLSFMAGGIIFPLWIGYSLTSLILAVNRCMVFSKYKKIFCGVYCQLIWISLPPLASLTVAFFGQSITYNSKLGAWFFNPHLGYFNDVDNTYPSTLQLWNNIIFCVLLPTVYIWFFIDNYMLSKKRAKGMPKKEYKLFIQCLIVNFTIGGAAAGYLFMQYLNLPEEVVCISHIAWIIVEGAPPIILLSMNETIRKIIFSREKKKISILGSVTVN